MANSAAKNAAIGTEMTWEGERPRKLEAVAGRLAATLALLEARVGPGVAIPRFAAPDGMTKLAAAWLIEQAGFTKGYTAGRVGISNKHALALVNRGGATAHELLALARAIQDGVRAKLGIELHPEPIIV